MYKSFFFKLTSIISFISLCFLFSCGTTGRITFYEFKVSKYSLEFAINNFLYENEGYRFPKNDSVWCNYAPKDSVIAYQCIDNIMYYKYKNLKNTEVYFYFKSTPEEVYQLHYYMNEQYWNNHPHSSRLALVCIVKNEGKWRYSDPIFNSFFRGRKRVEKRLEEEVLNKLPYKYEKVK